MEEMKLQMENEGLKVNLKILLKIRDQF